VIQTEMVLS